MLGWDGGRKKGVFGVVSGDLKSDRGTISINWNVYILNAIL